MTKGEYSKISFGLIILIVIMIIVGFIFWNQYEKQKTCEKKEYCYYLSSGFLSSIKIYVDCEVDIDIPEKIYTEQKCIN